MSLGVLRRTLSAFANGEVEQSIERQFGMIQDVSDSLALTVVTGCVQFRHSMHQSGWFWRIAEQILVCTSSADAPILPLAARHICRRLPGKSPAFGVAALKRVPPQPG
jgi:hypothetical protein